MLTIFGVTECREACYWHTIYVSQLMSMQRFIEKRDKSGVQVKQENEGFTECMGFF